jgi:hypothetical protein
VIIAAASSLPVEARDGFLRAIAASLSAVPSDDDARRSISAAIQAVGPENDGSFRGLNFQRHHAEGVTGVVDVGDAHQFATMASWELTAVSTLSVAIKYSLPWKLK